MKINWLKKRWRAGAAALALAAAFSVIQPAVTEAAPAPVYWTFRNLWVRDGEQCLTGGKINSQGTSSVFMTACVGGAPSQQWDWRGADPESPIPHLELQNRATGLCLATDNKSYNHNAVWASTCEWRRGMRFNYDDRGITGYLCPLLSSPSPCLSADLNSGAVYGNTDYSPDIAKDGWIGTHT